MTRRQPQSIQTALISQSAVVSLQNVTKDYVADGQIVRALRGVSLDVLPGEFVGIVGRSGCGKSTLLNVAGAMDLPSSGNVCLAGKSTASLTDRGLTALRREKIGFIFQSFQLLNTLSVVENVELPLMLAGDLSARRSALERLAWVELSEYASRYPHQLSGGQLQRVAIARALVHSPKLVLADEPTGNLDSKTGDIILELLRRIATERSAAVLMATHSAESAAFTDTVVRMRDGLIEEVVRN